MNSNFIVNKVLLAYSLAHLLMYCVWLLTTRAEKLLRRSFGLHSQKYLLSGPLETKFADSCLRARTQLDQRDLGSNPILLLTSMLLHLEDIIPVRQRVLSLGINERMHKDYHSQLPDVDNVKHMLLKKLANDFITTCCLLCALVSLPIKYRKYSKLFCCTLWMHFSNNKIKILEIQILRKVKGNISNPFT